MLVFRIHVFCCFRMSHISVADISQLPINWLTYSWILVEGSNESECLFLQCLLSGAVRWVSHWTEQYTTYLSKHLPGVVSPIISGSSITLNSRPSGMTIMSFTFIIFTFLFIWHWKNLVSYVNIVSMVSWADNIFCTF